MIINILNIFKGNNPVSKINLTASQKKIALSIAVFFIFLIIGVFFNDRNVGLALVIGLAFILLLSAITFLVFFKIGLRDKKLFQLFLIVFLIHLFSSLFLYYITYHTSFRLLGGGSDFDLYQNNAIVFANRLSEGIFSLKGLFTEHYFAIIIGTIYFFTTPHPIVGQLLTVWLASFSALLVYLLILEIGGSKKWPFLIALMASIYPSYLFFGGVLLKEIFIVPLVLSGILLSVQIFKKFSAIKFVGFFLVMSLVIHFRFYIGLALMFNFIICWFLVSNLVLKDKVIYGLAMIFILGFSPYMLGFGYLGEIPINYYLVPREIKNLREVAYAPISLSENFGYSTKSNNIEPIYEYSGTSANSGSKSMGPLADSESGPSSETDFFKERDMVNKDYKTLEEQNLTQKEIMKTSGADSFFPVNSGSKSIGPLADSESGPSSEIDFFKERERANEELKTLEGRYLTKEEIIKSSGTSSSFSVASGVENPFTFVINYFLSFIYTLLGPFPWQIKEKRQLIAFVEVIPWWIFFFVILYNIYAFVKNNGFVKFFYKYKYALPLALFSIISVGVISLFINNFGIITRIRMPALILFLCVLSLGPNFNGTILENWLKYAKHIFVARSGR